MHLTLSLYICKCLLNDPELILLCLFCCPSAGFQVWAKSINRQWRYWLCTLAHCVCTLALCVCMNVPNGPRMDLIVLVLLSLSRIYNLSKIHSLTVEILVVHASSLCVHASTLCACTCVKLFSLHAWWVSVRSCTYQMHPKKIRIMFVLSVLSGIWNLSKIC